MSDQLVLLRDTVCNETIDCLEAMLRLARKGDGRGIACAFLLRGKRYIINTAGEARMNPTFARGMVQALDDELARSIRDDDDSGAGR